MISTLLGDLASQHTSEVGTLGMKDMKFMYICVLKSPWKITFDKKVVCAVIEKQPDFITMTLDKITFHTTQWTKT